MVIGIFKPPPTGATPPRGPRIPISISKAITSIFSIRSMAQPPPATIRPSTLNVPVVPSSVTANNSAIDYTISGSGKIHRRRHALRSMARERSISAPPTITPAAPRSTAAPSTWEAPAHRALVNHDVQRHDHRANHRHHQHHSTHSINYRVSTCSPSQRYHAHFRNDFRRRRSRNHFRYRGQTSTPPPPIPPRGTSP